jgi:hypothetical protein
MVFSGGATGGRTGGAARWAGGGLEGAQSRGSGGTRPKNPWTFGLPAEGGLEPGNPGRAAQGSGVLGEGTAKGKERVLIRKWPAD